MFISAKTTILPPTRLCICVLTLLSSFFNLNYLFENFIHEWPICIMSTPPLSPPTPPRHLLLKPVTSFSVIFIVTHTYKYNTLLSPLTAVLMYMFRADQIGLDNPPGGSSLERNDSPSLRSHWLSVGSHWEVVLVKSSLSMLTSWWCYHCTCLV